MKRAGNYNWLGIVPLLILFSCVGEKHSKIYLQEVNVLGGEKQDDSIVFDDSQVSCVLIHGEPIISEIVDVGMIDNLCYILDVNNAISIVDFSDGTIKAQFKKEGHAKGELISPQCLTTDSTHVYIYDAGKKSIVIYNKNLIFEDDLDIEVAPSSMIKLNTGFLCYNDYSPTVYYINEKGEMECSREMSDKTAEVVTSRKIFTKGPDNKIYIKAEYSDTIFVWDGGDMSPRFVMNYDGRSADGEASINDIWSQGVSFTFDYFLTEQGLLIGYFKNKVLEYAFFDIQQNRCVAYKPSVKGVMPFIPRWQFGNFIFDIENKEVFQHFPHMAEDSNQYCQLVMLKYDL